MNKDIRLIWAEYRRQPVALQVLGAVFVVIYLYALGWVGYNIGWALFDHYGFWLLGQM